MSAAPKFTTDAIVQRYIALRDQIDVINAETKAKLAPIEKAMEVIAAVMLDMLNKSGEQSKRTEFGTAFIKESTFVAVGDWDVALDFIRGKEMWELLNHAVNKTAVQEYLKDHGTPPPGVNITQKKEVQFRRPTK